MHMDLNLLPLAQNRTPCLTNWATAVYQKLKFNNTAYKKEKFY